MPPRNLAEGEGAAEMACFDPITKASQGDDSGGWPRSDLEPLRFLDLEHLLLRSDLETQGPPATSGDEAASIAGDASGVDGAASVAEAASGLLGVSRAQSVKQDFGMVQGGLGGGLGGGGGSGGGGWVRGVYYRVAPRDRSKVPPDALKAMALPRLLSSPGANQPETGTGKALGGGGARQGVTALAVLEHGVAYQVPGF